MRLAEGIVIVTAKASEYATFCLGSIVVLARLRALVTTGADALL